ncbi:MAG: DUF808 domain-containing protein [Deltaproteobacteria bacterium]|jgi:predicted DNA repair protein MutK|nr:DUF808 domain-containing protein [Deltaproteobacteria bacterium]
MAGFTLLTLLDDISTVLDDVALMTKTAAHKTVGVVGDDLALTTQQLSGLRAAREIPVVIAVGKGSFVNKLILIPLALLISSFASFLITPLLMVGGSWLCLEGAEKVWLKLLSTFRGNKKGPKETNQSEGERIEGEDLIAADLELQRHQGQPEITPSSPSGSPSDLPSDLGETSLPPEFLLMEKKKIKGAVRTDFVLSAEIITIAMGSIPPEVSFPVRALALVLIGIFMTFGVYGFVGAVVKLDDLGFYLLSKKGRGILRQKVGQILVEAAPYLMRFLGVVGTLAMFLVGGGILIHGILAFMGLKSGTGFLSYLENIGFGLSLGFIFLALESGVKRIISARKAKRES